VSSMLRVGARCRSKHEPAPDFVQDVQSAVRFTTECLNAGFEAGRLVPDRVLTITYEALVTQAEAMVRQVCNFLGIAFDLRMLEPHAKKHPAQDAMVLLDKGTWVDPALGFRPIERSRIDAWAEDLDPNERELINSAFRDHPFLQTLGYRFDWGDRRGTPAKKAA